MQRDSEGTTDWGGWMRIDMFAVLVVLCSAVPVRSPSAPVVGPPGASHRSGIGTVIPPRFHGWAGCRGFKGPVPQPLWMSALSMARQYVEVVDPCQESLSRIPVKNPCQESLSGSPVKTR